MARSKPIYLIAQDIAELIDEEVFTYQRVRHEYGYFRTEADALTAIGHDEDYTIIEVVPTNG